MKRIRNSQFLSFTILLLLSLSPLSLSAIMEDNQSDIYIYLGTELSNIGSVIARIKDLDAQKNSPLNELHTYIEKGLLLGRYDVVLEACEYAETVLQRSYNTLHSEQLDMLFADFEILLNKIFNDELTVDSLLLEATECQQISDNDTIIRARHLPTDIVYGNLNVFGKTVLKKHLNTKQGAHIQGKLKVDKSARFKKNVTIEGDLVVAHCIDNLCVNNLSVVDASVSGTLSVNDLVTGNMSLPCNIVVGCNISLNDSTSADIGNIIKNGFPFIHDFGAGNTFVGINSGNFTMTGLNNTAMGIDTLSNNTSGYSNTVVGSGAMQNNITGYQNTAIGQSTLQNNSIGTDNTGVGNAALVANTTGLNNTGIGSGALASNDVGSYNTAVGHAALGSNTAGVQNVAVGEQALLMNTAGFYNTAVGQGAMLFNTTGSYNTATGTGALVDNITGNQNSALGYNALSSNEIGGSNTAVGYLALNLNIVDGNTAVGSLALSANTTGFNNTAVGLAALENNSIAPNNVAVGSFTLQANTVGTQNTAIGANALANNESGSVNTAIGQAAMATNTTGFNNTAVGDSALVSNTIGIQNSAVGANALANNGMGSNNTAIGQGALSACVSGNNNIALGIGAGNVLASSESNDIYIGNVGVIGESNTIRIGTPAVQAATFVAGVYNTTTGSATTLPVIVDSNGQFGTLASTRRVKHDIADMNAESALIYQMRPVTFVYNSDTSETKQYGLIAEEVDQVFSGMVAYDEHGEPYTVRYEVLPVLLLNEMQKQQARFDMIEQRLACLEAR